MAFLVDKSSLKAAVVSFLAAIIYLTLLINTPFFEIARLKMTDFFQTIKMHLKSPPPQINDIVNVVIDDVSIKKLNRPLNRADFALLIEKLSEYKPKVIALDIAFVGESPNPQDDIALQQALRKSGNVVLASFLNEKEDYIIPHKAFRENALGYGLSHKPLDLDFIIRRSTLAIFLADDNKWDYAFTLKVACKYLSIPPSNSYIGTITNKILLMQPQDIGHKKSYIVLPLKKDNTMLLNPLVDYKKFKTIPFWQVMEGESLPQDFKDKIIFVGVGSGFKNVFPTPFGAISGVNLNAAEALMIITENFIKEVPAWLNMLIIAFFYILTSFILIRLSSSKVFLCIFSVVAAFFLVGFLLLMNNYLLDFFNPVFIVILNVVTVFSYKHTTLLLENARLKTLAVTDGLTGLYIHRYFELKLRNEFRKSTINKTNLSLVIIDIDHFKEINDTYGHEYGNVVLKQLAQVLTKSSRRQDTVVRYGGEEFTVILPYTSKEEAVKYAEKIRRKVEKINFLLPNEKSLHLTLSAGVVAYPGTGFKSAEDLIKAADAALYTAKNAGRNRTFAYAL